MSHIARYSIVRFLPYAETEEFANVGVVMLATTARYFDFRLSNKWRRLGGFFDKLDRRVFAEGARAFKEELERKESQEKCLQNHIASVEAERDRIASQLQDVRAELHRSQGKVQELDAAYSEIGRLRTEISDREKLSAELGDALCSLDQYRKSAEDRNGRMADELEALRATVVDRDSLTNTPVESTRTDYTEECQTLRTEVDRLQEAVQEYRQQMDQLTEANEALEVAQEDGS